MAKELPYFQFEPAEYLTKDVSFCSLAAQGLFINICSYYWQRNCELTKEQVLRRLNYTAELEELISEGIIDCIEGVVVIKFLDNQRDNATKESTKNSINGSKGGAKKGNTNAKKQPKNNPKTTQKQGIRRDKKKGNKKKGKEIIEKNKPTQVEFLEYAFENAADLDRETVILKYKAWVANDWKDGNNNEVTNWKVKLLNTIPHMKRKLGGENSEATILTGNFRDGTK